MTAVQRPDAGSGTPNDAGAGLSALLGSEKVRAVFWQVVVLGGVGVLIFWLVDNTLTNLEARRIATGFDFLSREAGLPIGESVIPYAPTDSYSRAILVGLLNTLRVAAIGIVLATVLGTLIGIARLSGNWLLRTASSAYVELLRNTPLLLQLFFWYAILQSLPSARQALDLGGSVFISNRGLVFPALLWDPGHMAVIGAFVLGLVAAVLFQRWNRRRQALTGVYIPALGPVLGLLLVPPLLVFLIVGAPFALEPPVLRGFNFVGGSAITPEFIALLTGLTLYTAAFIAEIVRAGILAVSKGQWEAASALGLHGGSVMRLIILPQALRVIIPPTTSQYLNITKNSSLAIAIGYPDIVSVANTTLNQTGQAIEGIAIIMAAYLTVSLSISLFMNWYNRRIALVER